MDLVYVLSIIYGAVIFVIWNVVTFIIIAKEKEIDEWGILYVAAMFWPLVMVIASIISPALIGYLINKKVKKEDKNDNII